MSDKQLVIAFFENEATADAAVTEIKQWDAKVTGELMEMANGPLAMAAGFETRKELSLIHI